jgi:hypothetical protein
VIATQQIVTNDFICSRPLGAVRFRILPILVDDARYRLRVQVAFRGKLTIKTSARQSGFGHHIVNRHGIKTVAIEQTAGAQKD